MSFAQNDLRPLVAFRRDMPVVDEEGACRWQRASSLDRQKAGAFWLPWTFVNMLLRQLKARGHTLNAAHLEEILGSHAEMVKADSNAVFVDGQRQIPAS